MKHVTHVFNAMSSARRTGIFRQAGLLEFALSEPEIICELIADGHHVSPTLMKMLYRAKGAAGICLVTDATAAFSPEAMHAAHIINGPTYAHAILTTRELVAQLSR